MFFDAHGVILGRFMHICCTALSHLLAESRRELRLSRHYECGYFLNSESHRVAECVTSDGTEAPSQEKQVDRKRRKAVDLGAGKAGR